MRSTRAQESAAAAGGRRRRPLRTARRRRGAIRGLEESERIINFGAVADLGHTVAGWTGATITIVGSAICGLGVVTADAALILVGIAVLAVAALATWMLHPAGWGKPSGPRPPDQWDWRVRDLTACHGHPDCLDCRIGRRRPTLSHQPLTDPVATESQEPEKALARTASRAQDAWAEAPIRALP